MTDSAPKLFVSYSHDSRAHKGWVLQLASRLRKDGVDVILDEWDLRLGSDLSRFMESGLADSDRVLAICTTPYIDKADLGVGGVGYEKMTLTADLMKNTETTKIIPVVRNNTSNPPVPTFLYSRVYIDFRDDSVYEEKYAELLRDIHGEPINPKPVLGINPLRQAAVEIEPQVSFSSERYESPALSGLVVFDYSNNNGHYVVGAGDMAFETDWTAGGNTAIYVYTDPPSIRSVALANGANRITDIIDARQYDTSSRDRMPELGEIVVWQNTAGYYLATRIDKLQAKGYGSMKDELTFTYAIEPNKHYSFASVTEFAED